MEKEVLEELALQGLSTYQIAKELKKGQTTIRHWLKKYGLKTNHKKIGEGYINSGNNCCKEKISNGLKVCASCKIEKPISEFYTFIKRGKESYYSYCKPCAKVIFKERDNRNSFKAKAVEYAGGKCTICGYDRCQRALEFHHKNPKEKDFSISSMTFNRKELTQDVIEEVDKCVLLCANCHREVHDCLVEIPN